MIYFDNAATSIKKPDEVIEAVTYAMNHCGNAGRGVNESSISASEIIYDTRVLLNDFFNGEKATQIAFTSNATESLNIAIKGLLNPGDHVISTVLEHNSVLRPLYQLEKNGVEHTLITCDNLGNIDYNDIGKSILPNTKAIVITHSSNVTGNIVDIARVGEIAKKHGIIFIVDASQSAGTVPIDVQKCNIDVLCFTGHKGLLGPQGTGGLYVRPGIDISPLKIGGSGIMTYSKTHPDIMPTRLEAGTLNSHGIAGLGAAIKFINKEGIDKIHNKEISLMEQFYNGIKDIPGVRVYGDFSDINNRTSIVSINVGDKESGEVSEILYSDYDISIRSGGHCAPLMHKSLGTIDQGIVRFSFGYYNTPEEVNVAIKAINDIAKM